MILCEMLGVVLAPLRKLPFVALLVKNLDRKPRNSSFQAFGTARSSQRSRNRQDLVSALKHFSTCLMTNRLSRSRVVYLRLSMNAVTVLDDAYRQLGGTTHELASQTERNLRRTPDVKGRPELGAGLAQSLPNI